MASLLPVSRFVSDAAETFLTELRTAPGAAAVLATMSRAVSELGFDCFTYYAFGGPEPGFVAGTFPREWTAQYAAGGFEADDPVLRRLRADPRPGGWDCKDTELRRSARDREILDTACAFGLRHGLVVPIVADGGMRGLFAYASRVVPDDPRLLSALHVISLLAHGKYVEIRMDTPRKGPQLTEREMDCLHWAAAGKTDWEIGCILTIKETTVRTHLENARRKLDAGNRTHAVAEAFRLGLLKV